VGCCSEVLSENWCCSQPVNESGRRAQVWALDVGGEAEALLVTGGADARVNVWRDCTSADAAVAAAGAAEAARKAQQLANALQARAQANALQGL